MNAKDHRIGHLPYSGQLSARKHQASDPTAGHAHVVDVLPGQARRCDRHPDGHASKPSSSAVSMNVRRVV